MMTSGEAVHLSLRNRVLKSRRRPLKIKLLITMPQ
jgi:hypothetical protein